MFDEERNLCTCVRVWGHACICECVHVRETVRERVINRMPKSTLVWNAAFQGVMFELKYTNKLLSPWQEPGSKKAR